jgi:hypothetical protein
LLLKNGDFVDGEFQRFKSGRVSLNSVLLGWKHLPQDQALVLVLHDPVSSSTRFAVRTRNGSQFFVDNLTVEKEALRFQDSILDGWQVALKDLKGVERRSEAP